MLACLSTDANRSILVVAADIAPTSLSAADGVSKRGAQLRLLASIVTLFGTVAQHCRQPGGDQLRAGGVQADARDGGPAGRRAAPPLPAVPPHVGFPLFQQYRRMWVSAAAPPPANAGGGGGDSFGGGCGGGGGGSVGEWWWWLGHPPSLLSSLLHIFTLPPSLLPPSLPPAIRPRAHKN